MSNEKSWGTLSEIKFIKGIGSFGVERRGPSRATLLAGYIHAACRRKIWPDGMDRNQIIAYAQAELERELKWKRS